MRQSVDKYYPGTKLAITEYNFGGSNDICGSIAEADALGIFAKYGVYAANLFVDDADYQCAAINLYRNYDGNDGSFGDTLVYCETDNIEISTAYAAINGDNDNMITLVVTNKSFDEVTTANIKINGRNDYNNVHIFSIDDTSAAVIDITENSSVDISDDTISYKMQPKSVSLLVISKEQVKGHDSTPVQESKSKIKSTPASTSGIFACAAVAAIAACAVVVIVKKKRKP